MFGVLGDECGALRQSAGLRVRECQGGSVRAASSRSGSHTVQLGGGYSRNSKSNSALRRYAERNQGRWEEEWLRRRWSRVVGSLPR